jgi:hypothetical protein
VRQVADVEIDVDYARPFELLDDDLEDRALADRHQRLREDRGVRRSRAPVGEDDGLHGLEAVSAVRDGPLSHACGCVPVRRGALAGCPDDLVAIV